MGSRWCLVLSLFFCVIVSCCYLVLSIVVALCCPPLSVVTVYVLSLFSPVFSFVHSFLKSVKRAPLHSVLCCYSLFQFVTSCHLVWLSPVVVSSCCPLLSVVTVFLLSLVVINVYRTIVVYYWHCCLSISPVECLGIYIEPFRKFLKALNRLPVQWLRFFQCSRSYLRFLLLSLWSCGCCCSLVLCSVLDTTCCLHSLLHSAN